MTQFVLDAATAAKLMDMHERVELRDQAGYNNAINHEKTLRPMLDRALTDDRVDTLIVPIGKGEVVCRKKYRKKKLSLNLL